MNAYQQFVRDLRAIQRVQRQQRQVASTERRTLELGALGKAVSKGEGIRLKEYGQDVQYTIAQLRQFDSRRRAVERQFGNGATIAAILARMTPYPTFSTTSRSISSDLARARNIPRPDFVSARGDTLHFRVRAENPTVNAMKGGLSHHLTSVKLVEFEKALRTPLDKNGSYLPAVEKAIAGNVKVNCDCGRFTYWYRYKATAGGYSIKEERGFPKIRNARLAGTVCKHLVVTLNFLRQSKPLAKTLAARFERAASTVFPDKASETFANQQEQRTLKKARVDRKLRKVAKAKKDFKKDLSDQRQQEEKIRKAARMAARKADRAKRKKDRGEPEKFKDLQASNRALARQLKKQEAQNKAMQKKLDQQQASVDQQVAIQLVKALRSAGVDDATIKLNPVVKQSKIKVEEI